MSFFVILGGMGTIASQKFCENLISEFFLKNDQDYPDYLLINHASIPDRTDWILGNSINNPLPYLISDIKKSESFNPDFYVITCNTAHIFLPILSTVTDTVILDMIQITVSRVKENIKKGSVIVLATEGTNKSKVYQLEIEKQDLTYLYIENKYQKVVNSIIYENVKKGVIDSNKLENLIDDLFYEYEVDSIILGCTELSVLYTKVLKQKKNVYDSQSLLIEETLKRIDSI